MVASGSDLGSWGIWGANGPIDQNENSKGNMEEPEFGPSPPSASSNLSFLPPIEPAVPLRRNKRQKSSNNGAGGTGATWAFGVELAGMVNAANGIGKGEGADAGGCTGNPANCPACKDDAFGECCHKFWQVSWKALH